MKITTGAISTISLIVTPALIRGFTVAPSHRPLFLASSFSSSTSPSSLPPLTKLWTTDESAPSDYDSDDLSSVTQTVSVDENEEDVSIRDALKRELLLISSVTNRGDSATEEEKNIVIDLVAQLEALNPTADPAHNSQGEWDLSYSSVQSFRSSPFFMAIRTALGSDNKQVAETGFDIHDRATAASRVGRVRQIVSEEELVSEVELAVGVVPGLPVSITGTVITTAGLRAVTEDTWEVRVRGTKVKGSNVPLLNQYLDDFAVEVPVGEAYSAIMGAVPVSILKTFYVDEGIRITRDDDDNFFVFARV